MVHRLQLELGAKTDPIEYRYSYAWLFRLLAEEGIEAVQLGTSFELYQLPDEFFAELRRTADDLGVRIESIFTAHRELGGFFRPETGFEQVARRNFQRLVEIGGLLGAKSVGSNPGTVLRDRMGTKADGLACYMRHMKELMHIARECGVSWLTIETMSCLAEPPTLPEEIREMARQLAAYHHEHPNTTARVGYCVDTAHGYVDRDGVVRVDHLTLFKETLPHLYEIHLKNTDDRFESVFGFTAPERAEGIVDIPTFRDLLLANADVLPVDRMIGYLEIGGPKLGRDYSDGLLETSLRESLQYLKETFVTASDASDESVAARATDAGKSAGRPSAAEPAPSRPISLAAATADNPGAAPPVRIAPSIMCADLCHLEADTGRLERLGVDMLHVDVMDARFVPNMPLGLATIEQLRPKTGLPLDVHLMVHDNTFFIEQLATIGVDRISIHVESAVHLDRLLDMIRGHGILAGAALNPATPLSAIEYVVERLDFVMLMCVNPGFAGQKMTPSAIRKIADCRAMFEARGAPMEIEVDGNVSFKNIPRMVGAGADTLVAGTSSLFHQGGSAEENARRLRQAIAEGLAIRKRRPSQKTESA